MLGQALLELVPQAELKHPRLGERRRVLPEPRRIQGAAICGIWVEPHGIGYVEGLGAKLQRMRLVANSKQREPLTDPQVDAEEAIPAEAITLA